MDGWRHAESASMYQPNGTDISETLPGQVSAQILREKGATIAKFLPGPGGERDDSHRFEWRHHRNFSTSRGRRKRRFLIIGVIFCPGGTPEAVRATSGTPSGGRVEFWMAFGRSRASFWSPLGQPGYLWATPVRSRRRTKSEKRHSRGEAW